MEYGLYFLALVWLFHLPALLLSPSYRRDVFRHLNARRGFFRPLLAFLVTLPLLIFATPFLLAADFLACLHRGCICVGKSCFNLMGAPDEGPVRFSI